ncbi:MAG: glucose-1-phosphate thymidylyltransferase [Thermoplasmata archaeon]|nr:MAG: glucose-1-phosphate thymidylyltransferase [Thermoplasmata archaeon]
MKGLILAGGYGTRLRPLTFSQQKQLIPIANKPILFYAIEDFIEAGIHSIGIIIGPNKQQVMDLVESVSWDADIVFIEQDKPLGIAHTIKISRDFIGDDSFIMYLGDNILREGVVDHVKSFQDSNCDGSILLTEVNNPSEFGIAVVNDQGDIKQVIEKPDNPPTNFAVIGVYLFSSKIIEGVDTLKPSHRGQLEITDAIQWLLDNGYTVKSSFINHWWKDTGKPEDILHANRLILDDIKSKNEGTVSDSDLWGRIQVGENSVISKNSVVKGPVIIGKNCRIENAYIGPFTSIGDNCRICCAEVEDSVILDGCTVENSDRIVDSLIGRGVKIIKKNDFPKGKRFVIGDNSEVSL